MNTSYSLSTFPGSDGTSLALHSWAPPSQVPITGVVFYVHGIQSHAGWLLETGPSLAQRGITTYALDRHGSGRSDGTPGDLPSAQVIVDDYWLGLAHVKARHEELPLTVLGQSFGASIVASMAMSGLSEADQLVYCTPALGQQHARHSAEFLEELRNLTGEEYWPLGFVDEEYTAIPRYLELMANDHLMLRQITERSRATMVEIEDTYLGRVAECRIPVHLVRTLTDPIIDLKQSQAVLSTLHGEFNTVHHAENHHYIEFASSRRDYWDWLAGTVASAPIRRQHACLE